MDKKEHLDTWADNGGRRIIRDRRVMVSVPLEEDRRTNLERRSGFDRRIKPALIEQDEQRDSPSSF